MDEFFAVLLTGLLAFMSADYALGRATVKEPIRIIVAVVFALLLVVVAGVLGLTDVVSLD